MAGLAALVILLAFAVAAAVVAKRQRDRAIREETVATAGLLASTAITLTGSHPDLAQLFAVKAYQLDPGNPQTRAALFAAVQSDPQVQRFIEAPGQVSAIASSANGRTIVAGTRNGWVQTWSVPGFRPVKVGRLDGVINAVGGQRGRDHDRGGDRGGRQDLGTRPARPVRVRRRRGPRSARWGCPRPAGSPRLAPTPPSMCWTPAPGPGRSCG